MLTIIRYCCALALFLAAVAPAPVTAQDRKARAAARKAYGEGQKAFQAGEFAEAKAAFEEAFAAVPNPIVLRSIGECEAKLGEIGAAIESFERYLAEKPDADDRGTVEAKLDELRATPAVIALRSSPEGAQVQVDGTPHDDPTPTELEVSPGEHRLELTAPGHDTAVQTVTTEPGQRTELEVTLERLPEVEQPAEVEVAVSAEDLAPADAGSSTVALWVTGGLGVVGLAAGGVFGAMALSKQGDYEDNPTSDGADEGERLALFADVGFGVGAISLVTFAVILLTDGEAEAADDVADLRVSPLMSPAQTGLQASMRF